MTSKAIAVGRETGLADWRERKEFRGEITRRGSPALAGQKQKGNSASGIQTESQPPFGLHKESSHTTTYDEEE